MSEGTRQAGQLMILNPLEIRPGAIAPDGRVVKKAVFYECLEKDILIVDVTYENGPSSPLVWPLGNRWTGVRK